MFIIEKAVSDYNSKVEQWNRGLEKYLNEDTNGYRSERDYTRNHPRPVNYFAVVGRAVAIGVCIALVAILIVGFAKEIAENNKNKPKETPAVVEKSDKNCRDFNKGDKVRIQYGDHVGNVGTVIGGCGENEKYQVKIDDGSKADVSDSNPEPVDVGGWTISVDSKDNLVKIEEK